MRYLWLILIILAAFFLRFYKVTRIPPSLNWDEASITYNAYSILKTGRDEWGRILPLHFQSYGEYKLPAQVYFSIPAIALLGLNELGVRITPVVYGTLTVLILYFLASGLFKNKGIGLLSAFLLAISPWHIQLTRASFESSFSVFWVSLGALFFIKGFEKSKWWLFSVVSFAISVYTYNAARVFVPIFLFTCALLYRKEVFKNLKLFTFYLIFFISSLIPLFAFWFSGEATARLKLVSVTDDPGFVLRINEARGKLDLPGILPRVVHNKVTHFTYVYTKNYLAHFTPDFLFVSGAGHKQHHVQGIGEFYAIQAPFILLGIYFLFKKKNKWRWFITSWLLLVFIPVSITVDSIPNALRTVLAVIPYEILTAYGFWEIYKNVERKKAWKILLIGATSIALLVQMKSYLINYFNLYPKLYSRDWQYGYKEVVGFIGQKYDEYDLIVFSRHYGEPHMFTLFYLNWDPAKFQNDKNLERFETYDWVRVLRFDKFYFPDLGDEGTTFEDVKKEYGGKRMLFIGKPGDFPESYPKLFTVDFLNGGRAFEVVEAQ